MRMDNYNVVEKEVKTWFGINLRDSLKLISANGNYDKNLNKIVNFYNENTEESLIKLRKCIHEIKVKLLELQYNCKLNGNYGYNNLKIIKDYSLIQLADALHFSTWLKQELSKVGIGSFYDICWSIGGSNDGNINGSSETIDTLELTVRSHNALKRAGINTIDDLRKFTVDELRNIRNLGQKCLEEIISKLADRGYVLRDESSNNNTFEGMNNNIKRVILNDQCYNEIKQRFNAIGIELY